MEMWRMRSNLCTKIQTKGASTHRTLEPTSVRVLAVSQIVWKRKRFFWKLLWFRSNALYICRFKTQGRVKSHMNVHIRNGSESSPPFNASWVSSNDFLSIFFIGKLNWICELCGKGFGGPLALANHTQMIHSTERPWRCEVCGLGY